jgi:apolipoprotein N-acyltransferase
MGLAFLPGPFGFLAWFALVPFLLALDASVRAGAGPRRVFGLGYVFGLAFYLVGTHWIALLSDVAITVPWLKYPAWVAAAAYLALFPALAATASAWLARRSGVALHVVVPFVWIAVEELRASGEMGFPWFQPGYTQHAYVPLLQMASLGGVTLVTFWLLWINVLLGRALAGPGRARAALGAGLLLLLPWTWGSRVLAVAPGTAGPPVALVQGNIPGEIKWSGEHQAEILDTFLTLSRAAATSEPRPVLIVWPETATGSYLRRQIDQALAVTRLAATHRTPVFSGYADWRVDATGTRVFHNAAGMFRPDGSMGEVYAKRHLVPFGERMPFQWLVPAIGRIELGQAEWTPGDREVMFQSEAGRFSPLICFESIFPDLSRRDVRAGAEWLVNITNDEWFGDSGALYQHAAMAVFRAVENHVPLARCANTGLTMMIDAHGRVVKRLPVFRPGVLIERVPPRGRGTLFTRVGDWVGLMCGGAVALLAALAWLRPLTGRGRGV